MSDPREIINRCTRNGTVAWQAVAKQLGVSVDAARSRYDPSYLHVRPWPHRCEAVTPEGNPAPIDENDTSSPHPKGPGLKALILQQLLTRPASVEVLAARLGRTVNSIRMRLSQMRRDGLVDSDSAQFAHPGGAPAHYEWTWSITDRGADVTRCAGRAKERA